MDNKLTIRKKKGAYHRLQLILAGQVIAEVDGPDTEQVKKNAQRLVDGWYKVPED